MILEDGTSTINVVNNPDRFTFTVKDESNGVEIETNRGEPVVIRRNRVEVARLSHDDAWAVRDAFMRALDIASEPCRSESI